MVNDLASIVILTYNRLEYLKHCLASVVDKAGYEPVEIIVVDSGSSDGTRQYLLELLAQNRIQQVVLNSSNRYAGAAVNQGFKLARGQFLIRSDDDMVYNRGWLKTLVDALQKIPNGILQVAVYGDLVPDGKVTHFHDAIEINGVTLRELKIGGCNMALTRQGFEQLGYFEEIPIAEDRNYCRRALQHNFVVGQIATATGTHIDHPGCSLCLRYTTYSQYRLQTLLRLKEHGRPFPFEGDYRLYEQWLKNEEG